MKKATFLIIYLFLCSSMFAQAQKTLEEIKATYPLFEKSKYQDEAEKESEKISRIPTGTEIEIVSKRGAIIKGKYYKRTSNGGVEIGMEKIPWIDIQEKDKFLFDEQALRNEKKKFIEKYLNEKKSIYENDKNKYLEKQTNQLLVSENNLGLNSGRILYNFEVNTPADWGAQVKHDKGEVFIKYSEILPTERRKIKSPVTITLNYGTRYSFVYPITKSTSDLTIYCQDKSIRIPFTSLSEEQRDRLGCNEEVAGISPGPPSKANADNSQDELSEIDKEYFPKLRSCFYWDAEKKKPAYYENNKDAERWNVIVFQIVSNGLLARHNRIIFYIETETVGKSCYEGQSIDFLLTATGTYSYINRAGSETTVERYKDIGITKDIFKKYRTEIYNSWDWWQKKLNPPKCPHCTGTGARNDTVFGRGKCTACNGSGGQ